jgi:hypothetical protein
VRGHSGFFRRMARLDGRLGSLDGGGLGVFCGLFRLAGSVRGRTTSSGLIGHDTSSTGHPRPLQCNEHPGVHGKDGHAGLTCLTPM